MKTIKFLLAALVIPAFFAACTKDEVAATQESMQADKYPGAELIGSDISVNFGRVDQTKLTATAWESTDKLGLAWAKTANAFNAQAKVDEPESAIYANHLFELYGKDFSTKGNVYKGWHFAYFPFKYQEVANADLSLELNPKMTEKWEKDAFNTALYVSPREFLTKKDHLNADNQLENVKFDLRRAVSTIGLTVTPVGLETEALKNLKITGFQIYVNNGSFSKNVKVIPAELPAMVYDPTTEEYDSEETMEQLIESFSTAIVADGATSTTLRTDVDNDEINLSAPQRLRAYLLPQNLGAASGLSVGMRVFVEGGSFSIGYVSSDADNYTAAHGVNNKAIADIKTAFDGTDPKNPGILTYFTESGALLSLNIQVTKEMFNPDFTSISSLEEWNKCVAVANDMNLGATEDGVVFTVDNVITVNANQALNVANGKFTVHTAAPYTNADDVTITPKILVASSYSMPKGIADALHAADKVEVKSGATLTVEKGVTLTAAVTNKGTINVKNGGVITEDVANRNNGVDARINLEYGSTVPAGINGVVAYDILAANETVLRVNNMFPMVNTLVVNSGVTFDLMMSSASKPAEDEYDNSVAPGAVLDFAALANKAIEMKGGILLGEPTLTLAKVGAVKVKSGNNTIKDVNVASIDVASGSTLNLDATTTTLGNHSIKNEMTIDGTLHVDGNLVSNVTVHTDKVDNAHGNILVNSAYTIWYDGNKYVQGGVAEGKINPWKAPSAQSYGATVNSLTTFNTQVKKSTISAVEYVGELTSGTKAVPAVYDLKGKILNLKQATFTTGYYKFVNGKIDSKVNAANATNVVFENITFTGDAAADVPGGHNYEGIVYFTGTTDVTFDGCFFKNNYRPLVVGTSVAYNGKLSIMNSLFACSQSTIGTYHELFIATDALGSDAKIKLTGNVFESGLTLGAADYSTSVYEVKNNTIAAQVELYANLNNVPAATKSFADYLVNNNTFKSAFKFKVWSGSSYKFINEF